MIVGFSEGVHNAALAIIDNGEILFASESERYTRVKNDNKLGTELVTIANSSVPKHIAFYENPLLKKTRQLFSGQYKKVFKRRKLSLTPSHYFEHHLSHAAATFQTSPFTSATVVIVDSIGEWDTASIWTAEYNLSGYAVYKKVWSKKYPYSMGLFYSSITDRVGLKPNEDEYILMGMAAYGNHDEQLFWDMYNQLKYRNNHRGCRDLYQNYKRFDLAKNAQSVIESELKDIFLLAITITGNRTICYGGGVALNCVANSKLRELVDDLWIFPNPGDAGSAIGAAALVHKKHVNFSTCYLGHEIAGKYPVSDALSELLTNGLVGVANGKAEFGPRALGNRSLFADPRNINTKQRVNEIKQRQQFRPFAPVILEEHCKEWFDIAQSKYMQYVATCLKPHDIPAVCHVDRTSRVQTVSEDGSGIRKLLEAWYEKTGCPVLLNTSLNIKGQPMVNDKKDAIDFSKKYDVKVY